MINSRRKYDTDLAVVNSGVAVSGVCSIELITMESVSEIHDALGQMN